MKKFATLLLNLDRTNSTIRKVEILVDYLQDENNEKNKLWATALLMGKKPKGTISTALLRQWCSEVSGIPLWLFEQNYYVVGDLAETISLVLPHNTYTDNKALHSWMEAIVLLKPEAQDLKKDFILEAWSSLDKHTLWVFNKLITGGFRIGVSKNIVIQALAEVFQQNVNQVAYLLSGDWSPQKTSWSDLFKNREHNNDLSKPYPFFLTHALPEGALNQIEPITWTAEYKWDGIRGQLIKRMGKLFLWSRGEEIITEKFPEFGDVVRFNKDFVLDGEIVAWGENQPMGFQEVQSRAGRKKPSKKKMEEIPVKFIAYDLLEINQCDIRTSSFIERRNLLTSLISELGDANILISPTIPFQTAEELDQKRIESKAIQAEGLMLKRNTGIYHSGRKSGDMWKWKIDPFYIDAVLIYAQRGHGRRANLFSDFTFGLWHEGNLIPFAKAYSGLTEATLKEITNFIKSNTIETFGPVRVVRPEMVFELAFEGISLSKRHKSGIAVRFPRISRWRQDKRADQADSLDEIKKLLKTH